MTPALVAVGKNINIVMEREVNLWEEEKIQENMKIN
jgi:hypothetical protein